MKMTRYKYIYLTTIFLYLFISIFPAKATSDVAIATFDVVRVVAAGKQSGGKVEVKARIPERTYMRIFGYTAPNSIVQAIGVRTFAQCSSDKTGYFVMYEVPVSAQAKEICITTIDAERRGGHPLCITLPDEDRPTEIGPLLLAPTLSLSVPMLWQNQTAYASGRTIPEQTVEISLFEVPSSSLVVKLDRFWAKIFPSVYAWDLPRLTTVSDKTGAFSFSLPTSKAIGFRVFTKAIYQGMPTPKSQTLSFYIGAITNYFLLNLLPKFLLLLVILAIMTGLYMYERKTKQVTILWLYINEMKLKPAVVRSRLKLRRLWYNFQDWKKSHRI